MKPSRLKSVLAGLLAQRWPAFVWGPPGVGKSAIVREVAAEASLPVLDLRATLLDPTDLRGIPAVVEGRAVWSPPSFLPTSADPPGILFLDELNAAPPLVQAGLYQLVLDRRVGEYELPAGWWIVAAGNRQQDRAVTFRMSSALANRFVHLTLDVDVEDWRAWALRARLNPLVVSFVAVRPNLLREDPADAPAFASPRSWEMVSDVIKAMGGLDHARDILAGIVGEGPATELAEFSRSVITEAILRRFVEFPEETPVPSKLDDLYALTSWMAHHAEDPEVSHAGAILLSRLPPEFGAVLARDLLHARPSFVREPGYKAFLKAHGQLIIR